jgi:hypothetical protein
VVNQSAGILILLSCLSTGCIEHGPHTRPKELSSLAAQFKAKAGMDRIAEGKRIAALLPTYRERPYGPQRPWWLFGNETGDAPPGPDYDHPSYKLSKEEFFQLMGQPDHFRRVEKGEVVVTAVYDLGRDKKGDGFALFIGCYKDLVICGGLANTNVNVIQAITTRRNPDGSLTVVTNYMRWW